MAIVRLGSEHNTTASSKHIVIIFALKRDDDDAAAAVAVGNVGAEFGVNDDDDNDDVGDVDFKDGRRHRRWVDVDVDDVAKVGLTSFTNGTGLMSFTNDVGLTSISFMYDAVDDIIIVDVIGGGDISPISGSVECDVK